MDNFNFKGFFEWLEYWVEKIVACFKQTKDWVDDLTTTAAAGE